MKVGIDIEDICRFEKMDLQHFCRMYFTEYESQYALKKGAKSVAGLFSCKESILKAIGVGIGGGIKLKDISILHDKFGKPYVEDNQRMIEIKKQYNIKELQISISHTKEIVESICIII